MIDYLEQGLTINGAYYVAELRSLRSALAGQCACSHVASCNDCCD